MNKTLLWTINIAGGVFFFFFFLFLVFPYEILISHFLSAIETQTNGAYRVTVDEITPRILFKSRFANFAVHKLDGGADTVLARFPEVKIGIHYLTLLRGTIDASFIAGTKGGNAEGNFYSSASEHHFDCRLNDLDLSAVPYLATFADIPLQGKLGGSLSFTVYPAQWNKNTGKAEVKMKNLMIPKAKVTPYPGFDLDLPDTQLAVKGEGVIKMTVEGGKLEVTELTLPGEDVVVNLKGRILTNRRIEISRLSLNGSFMLSEKIKNAIPLTVVLDKQKNEDGSYPLVLSGRISAPRIQIGSFEIPQ